MSYTATTEGHRRVCKATRAGGGRCRAKPLLNGEFCFWHDPSQVRARKAAGSKGGSKGRIKTLPDDTPDLRADNADRIVKLLSRTINQTLKGEIDPKVANAVGYLSGVILRAKEQGDLLDRIKEVEERFSQENTR